MVRHTYAEVHERARLCALALRRLGVEQSDRVATIAWNTWRHLECWSAPFHPLTAPLAPTCCKFDQPAHGAGHPHPLQMQCKSAS